MDYFEYCTKTRSAWPSVECLEDLSFVIYYVPDVDCLQAKRYFTWEERKDIVRELDFVFERFSLRDSFLKEVREARIRGKKHWKKRRWKLPVKKRGCGAEGAGGSGAEGAEGVATARYNVSWALKWAVDNQDLSSFDVFWENLSVLVKCGEVQGVKSKQSGFKLFVDKVEKMK